MGLIPFTSIKTILPGTLAELNANISDATLDDSGDSRPPDAHNIASHSDTTATGAELETLTDGSDADSLHTHSSGIDHGGLTGLSDDDHTQYLLADGSRDLTGALLVTLANRLQFRSSDQSIRSSSGGVIEVNAAVNTRLMVGGVKKLEATSAGVDVTGNIGVSGTVDGRDVAADGTKLDTVEDNATADQSNAEIKIAYEANADTNEFSDAEQTKLAGIEASADVTDATNVDAAGATMNADFNASGDIITATGNDAPAILSVGANGQIIVADSAQAKGIKWADVIRSFAADWPDPVISPTPDEYNVGYFHETAEIIEIGAHVVAGTGTVDFQIYKRPRATSGSGTTSLKTSGDFQATTTYQTYAVGVLNESISATEILIAKAISFTGTPTLVRLFFVYKLV